MPFLYGKDFLYGLYGIYFYLEYSESGTSLILYGLYLKKIVFSIFLLDQSSIKNIKKLLSKTAEVVAWEKR